MHSVQARWIDIAHHDDDRGKLAVLERSTLPFAVKRIFYIYDVPCGVTRGGHAHLHEQQCLITLAGRFSLDVSDGTRTETFVLNDPTRAVYVAPRHWVHLHDFHPGTIVLVASDMTYDPDHVVNDWDAFRRLAMSPSPIA